MISAQKPIGFIGIGNVGYHMVINLINSGFPVVVYDLRPEPLQQLAELGASIAKSVGDIAKRCDIIQVLVASDDQVKQVVGDIDDSFYDGGGENSTVLIHATVHPDTVKTSAEMLAKNGCQLIDAPVSGIKGAEVSAMNQCMTFMLGGQAGIIDKCRPVLEASGTNILHIGDYPGAGQTAKIIANLIGIVTMEAVREGMKIGKQAGLSADLLLNVISNSTAACWSADNWKHMRALPERHQGGADAVSELGHKDLSHACSLAWQLGTPAPLAALASQLIERPFGTEKFE